MGNIGITELVVILVIVLIIFGVGKLPEVGAGLGKGIREFRKATKDEKEGLAETKEAGKTENKS